MNRRRVALVLVALALFPLGGCSGDGSAGPEDDFTTSDLGPDVAPSPPGPGTARRWTSPGNGSWAEW